MTRLALPVDDALPDLLAAVRAHRGAVVTAPPGSGKTTRVPPALLDVVEGQIWVLQPRRVAARLTAQRIASELGSAPGDRVGWRVRFEDRTGPNTRLVVVTEGLLTRRLQDDPFLEGIGAVVLDEVHERSLHTDLALGLLREVQRDARPDLVLVAMSATLDAEPLSAFLDVPIVSALGRAFPVDVAYVGERSHGPLAAHAARAVREHHRDGSTLVFLPGRRAIRHTADLLADLPTPVFQLHGGLSLAEQQRALTPGPRGHIVLATNIAETSVTVPGVRTVIDAGLVKTSRFDPALGIERLVTERISAASAEQRAGRAGRTGPGHAVRLWSSGEFIAPFTDPAVQREDLAELCLHLHAWGTSPDDFAWFERPSDALLRVAEQLLVDLGAVRDGQLTPLGRTLARLPTSPRLGAVLVRGHQLGSPTDAAGIAALASERDPWPDGVPGAAVADDIAARLPLVRDHRRLRQVRDQLVATTRRTLGPGPDRRADDETLGRCLLAGFPDRLGRRTAHRRYKMLFGGAVLEESSIVEDAPLVVALNVRGAERGERAEHHLGLVSPIDPAWLDTEEHRSVVWDRREGAVVERIETRAGPIVIHHRSEPAYDAKLLAQHAKVEDLQLSDADRELIARITLLARQLPELNAQPVDLQALLPQLCEGKRTRKQLSSVNVGDIVHRELDWKVRSALDTDAPTHLDLPSGSRRRLEYGEQVVLSVRIQQVFGWSETPRIARGRVPVVLELLSPASRPVQITQDLASFWDTTWTEVCKEMRGRYPKHAWPDDPRQAVATDRPKRRRPSS